MLLPPLETVGACRLHANQAGNGRVGPFQWTTGIANLTEDGISALPAPELLGGSPARRLGVVLNPYPQEPWKGFSGSGTLHENNYL